MILKIFSSSAVLLLLISSLTFSQTEKVDSLSYRISDVVITATKTETPVYELASSITVIDSTEIADSKKTTVFDLLKDEYGLSFTQQGGAGMIASVYLRGSSPAHTLVLVDGIEMNLPNDPSNTFDFSYLSVDNIKRIEILRGPQSTLYGSNALAGVINIITEKGTQKPAVTFRGEGGSYNTFKGSAGFLGSIKSLNYNFNFNRFQTEGLSSADKKYGNTEKDSHTSLNVSSRLGYQIAKNFNVTIFAMYNAAETDYDQWGKVVDGIPGDDPTYIFELEETSLNSEGNLSLFDGLWKQSLSVSFIRNIRQYSFDSTQFNPKSSSSNYNGSRLKFEWQNNFNINKNNKVVFGLETENEKAVSQYFEQSAFPYSSIFPEQSMRTNGTYLQHQLNLSNNFFNTAGVRIDDHEKFGSAFTYRIAPAYIFWKTGTKLKVTYGTGFKAPSLFYLFDPAFGNENLQPEESYGWDAGFEQYLFNYRFTIGITYFNNTFKNLFGFDSNFKTTNINKAETKGVELFVKIIPLKNLRLNANYTYTKTKDLGSNPLDYGKPLLRRPEHKIAFNANYTFDKRLTANLEVIYSGKRFDKIFPAADFTLFPERVGLKPYTLVNLALTYDIIEFAQLYSRVENIFDVDYEEVAGYSTPGLSAYFGFKLKL